MFQIIVNTKSRKNVPLGIEYSTLTEAINSAKNLQFKLVGVKEVIRSFKDGWVITKERFISKNEIDKRSLFTDTTPVRSIISNILR